MKYGHPGINETLRNIVKNNDYKIPIKYIRQYISKCDICQLAKHKTQRKEGLLRPLNTP
jgi:Integrase zinc binding domain